MRFDVVAMMGMFLVGGIARAAEARLTIDEALGEALMMNARLPVARADLAISEQTLAAARARVWPAVSAEGDLRFAEPKSAFPDNGSEQRLELFVRGPLYAGGAIAGRINEAEAGTRAASARFRVAEADVVREVRVRFAGVLAADAAVAIEHDSVARLAEYLDVVRLRQKAGEGVQADVLTAQTQLLTQRAALVDAEQRAADRRSALNELLGREPNDALELSPLPAPSAPAERSGDLWLDAPELQAVAADVRAATAGVDVVRAERLPHFSFELGGGYLGVADAVSPSESLLTRVLGGFGVSAMLSYEWSFFDFGIYDADLHAAKLELGRAYDEQIAETRSVHFSFARALTDVDAAYRRLKLLEDAVPSSRDAFLSAESLYRGGAGTALAVVDAHRVWVDAALSAVDAELAYRQAEADAQRFGAP